MDQRVRKVALVVSCRKVDSLVRPARFFPGERRIHDGVGHVQHERQLQRGDSLGRAVEKLQELRDRFEHLGLDDQSRTFNTERVAAIELSFMLDVADAIIRSALRRTESRGAHQRTDFPQRDDQRFLAHSLIYQQPDGSSRVEYAPVTITRWPPAERVYGR